MNNNKFWAAVSKALAVVTVTLVVTLMLAPGAWAEANYKALHKFTGGTDGSTPYAGLIFDGTGNLYGTTYAGGSSGSGVVFELSPNPDGSWTENVLQSFTGGSDGANPYAGLIFDGTGNLYGTTYAGGGSSGYGVVFELSPNPDGSWTENVLHSFTGGNDGAAPRAGVIFDAAGNLYGTTYLGGTYGFGTVFELSANADGSWAESVLHSFKNNRWDGGYPTGGLSFGLLGNLYGTTQQGGAYGEGMVFELVPNADGSWAERKLHKFSGGSDGSHPSGSLVLDAAGNLYGTASSGGEGGGVVFKLTYVGGMWQEPKLYKFHNDWWGGYPTAGVIFDATGHLYGTASSGGYGYGVAFRLTPKSGRTWGCRILHAFSRATPGGNPSAGLVFDGAGNLYGTAAGDGTKTFGAVFEITP